jgi:hypothetical protein
VPTSTLTETATESPSLTPEPPTLTATDPAVVTETLTATLEASLTTSLTDTPASTSTATALPVPSAAVPTVLENMNLAPEADIVYLEGMQLAITDTFEHASSSVLESWGQDIRSYQTNTDRGQGLRFQSGIDPLPLYFETGNLQDVIAQANFQLSSGVARLVVRHSGAGQYDVWLGADGQVILYRGTEIISKATTTPGEWHLVQLSAVVNQVIVTIDGSQLISYTDPNPLPSGMVLIMGAPNSNSDFVVDDFGVSGIIGKIPEAGPMDMTFDSSSMQSKAISGPETDFAAQGSNTGEIVFVSDRT